MRKGIASPATAAAIADQLAPAMAFHRTRQFVAAEAAYREILSADPHSADAWCNLSATLGELGRYDEAIDAGKKAIAYNPKIADAHNNLGSAYSRMGEAAAAMAAFAAAAGLAPENWGFTRNMLAASLYRDDYTAADIARLHQKVRRRAAVPHLAPYAGHERIRVGFLSSDLRSHVVGNLLLPLARRLDPARFELHFYGHDSAYDDVTEDYKRIGRFMWIDRLTDSEAAHMIRRDEIDILVSLAGHLDRNRAGICAFRAAPVQVSMGDVATSGIAEMDYLIGDSVVIPENAPEWFSERVLRVNPIYVTDGFPAGMPDVRARGDSEPPIFGCFNNPAKISNACLAAWGEILRRVPAAHLYLSYTSAYENSALRHRVSVAIEAAGAHADQIMFNTDQASLPEFLDRYNEIDVALDTFPFSGSTTTFHALAMGLPLVTLAGDRMSARWSASMLAACGFDGACDSSEQYVAGAVRLTSNQRGWRRMREHRRKCVAASTLCAANAYAAKIAETFINLVESRHP